jgi:hypothetical protein
MKKILFLLVLASCKKRGSIQPPPVAAGKCLVERYEGSAAAQQTCTYGGYTWNCTYDTCNRSGEAVGERPLVDAGTEQQ